MISTIHVKNPTRQRTPKTRNNKNKNDDDDKDRRKYYIWLQERGDQNQLLKSFKLSIPQKVNEEYLQSYIYFSAANYFKAVWFKIRLHIFIKTHYHSYYRIRYKLEPLNNPSVPYIWIGTSCKNHLNDLTIIKRPAEKKYLKNCLYFHNTNMGAKRAERLLNKINTFINENYQYNVF